MQFGYTDDDDDNDDNDDDVNAAADNILCINYS